MRSGWQIRTAEKWLTGLVTIPAIMTAGAWWLGTAPAHVAIAAFTTAFVAWLAVYLRVLRPLERASRHSHALFGVDGAETPHVSDPVAQIERDLEAAAAALRIRDALIEDAEASVRNNEARYRDLFESNPHPMVVFDAETLEILAANDAATRRYGYSRQQFLRMTVRHLLPEPVTDGVPGVLSRMAVDHEHPQEDVHRRRDGELLDVEVSSHRFRFAGRPAVLSMFSDITLRKRAEAQIRRRTQAMQSLYESAREQSASLNEAEVSVAIVRAAVQRFGASAAWLAAVEETRKLRILAALPSAETGSEATYLSVEDTSPSLLACERQQAVEYPADGVGWEKGPWPVTAQVEPATVGLAIPLVVRGNVTAILHLLRDTPWKDDPEALEVLNSFAIVAASSITNAQMHERLQETARWLEQRVQERTAELEEANRGLQAFSYSVSHDLRAPLRGISGFARLLLEEYGQALPPGGRDYVSMIQCNAQEMEALIRALLAFSRSTRQPLHVSEVDPNALVEMVLNDLRREAVGRNIEFHVGSLPLCMADRTLLKQVFYNLLSNAVKYTRGRDPARIEVGAFPSDETTIYYVKDNGVGFDPVHADRLFGVFQRLHSQEEFPGTGVGLATVQRIVTRHGGRIWCEAAPDRGATFFFTISPAVNQHGESTDGTPASGETL